MFILFNSCEFYNNREREVPNTTYISSTKIFYKDLFNYNYEDICKYNSGIIIPEKLEMTVVSVDPSTLSSTATKPTKEAVVETGLKLRVPDFIKEGEKIIVTTCEGKYFSRA